MGGYNSVYSLGLVQGLDKLKYVKSLKKRAWLWVSAQCLSLLHLRTKPQAHKGLDKKLGRGGIYPSTELPCVLEMGELEKSSCFQTYSSSCLADA